jgi:cobalamin biosynthesis Mg chelatase CobN
MKGWWLFVALFILRSQSLILYAEDTNDGGEPVGFLQIIDKSLVGLSKESEIVKLNDTEASQPSEGEVPTSSTNTTTSADVGSNSTSTGNSTSTDTSTPCDNSTSAGNSTSCGNSTDTSKGSSENTLIYGIVVDIIVVVIIAGYIIYLFTKSRDSQGDNYTRVA